jgi:hypothetical protein
MYNIHECKYTFAVAYGLLLATAPACVDDAVSGDIDGTETGDGDGDGDCIDDNEPNESESMATAVSATPISDCDGAGGSLHGAIIGANDTDWYIYQGNDTTWCYVEPTQSVTPSDEGIRVCAYVECLSGTPDFGCPGGTTDDTSPEGRPGCCSDKGGFQIQLDCAGSFDASPVVFIRIDQPQASADTCNEYTLAYYL